MPPAYNVLKDLAKIENILKTLRDISFMRAGFEFYDQKYIKVDVSLTRFKMAIKYYNSQNVPIYIHNISNRKVEFTIY